MENVLYIFPQKIKEALLPYMSANTIEEIRIGEGKPILLKETDKEILLRNSKGLVVAGKEDIENILKLASNYSMYLKEDEINAGYINVSGGYRIGICGTVSYLDGKIIHHGDIKAINIRIPKEVIGCSEEIIKYICNDSGIKSTLLISPPRKGKTTMLRDVSRILSDNEKMRIGIVDERGELYGNGRYNLGLRSDVICGCKKSDGIMMMIRSMSPDVIIVDELGDKEDEEAIRKALTCGICVIASIHGKSVLDILGKKLGGLFEQYIILDGFNQFSVFEGGSQNESS